MQIGGVTLTSPTERTSFQQSITVPVLDYALRLPKEHQAAARQGDSAALTERSSRLQVATEARVSYYSWPTGSIAGLLRTAPAPE